MGSRLPGSRPGTHFPPAQMPGLVTVRHHADLRPAGLARQQPPDDLPRSTPLRSRSFLGVRAIFSANDREQRLVGHGCAAVHEDADLPAFDLEADEIRFPAGLGNVDDVRSGRGPGFRDRLFERRKPLPPGRRRFTAALRFLPYTRKVPGDGRDTISGRRGPAVHRLYVAPELLMELLETAQVGLQNGGFGHGPVGRVLDQHEHEHDRAQPARHDVQEGDVEPLCGTPPFQFRPAELMRLSRNASQ